MEEEPGHAELQKIPINLVPSDDIEELQFNHPSSIIEDLIVNGDQTMIDVSNEFLSLSTKFFENREDLIAAVRKIGLVQGYVLVIKRSKTNRYVVIGCDRGGCYRTAVAPENKKNNSSSRLINCPFKILGKRTAEGLWKAMIDSLLHNHEPSTDMAGHPYCR